MTSDELARLRGRKKLSAALTDDTVAQTLDPQVGETTLGRSHRLALLLVDVDRFAQVAGRLGAEAADQVLATIGARMQTALRPNQLMLRLGGDEFAVVLPDAGVEVAERVAQSLLAQLEDEIDVADRPVRVSASVGIATCRLPRDDPGLLVDRAAMAVHRAKLSGGGISHYTENHGQDTARRPPLAELRVALERGDLEVHLQPQIRLADGAVHGAEALARWRHPQDGVLLPAAFLPLAAQTGLMRPVATLVCEQAIDACQQWWRAGHQVPVSVNLTAGDVLDDTLIDSIRATLQRTGLPARALRVELTEEVFLDDPEAVAEVLHRWRDAGVGVALDDFGTGYSSLAHLRELPFEELKLDQVFIRDLNRPTTSIIVQHTVAMAHDLGMTVVAEGIENADIARRVVEIGCDVGQGMHYSPAMPLPQFLEFLAER